MEAVMCKVAVSKKNGVPVAKEELREIRSMAVYLYNIAGVTIMLHASVSEDKPKFTCSEYFTGYAIRYGNTMQEALDNTSAAIGKYVDPVSIVNEKIQEIGIINKPAGG